MQLFAKDLLILDSAPNGTKDGREAHRVLLAADSLRASGRLRLRVHGESMLPNLWPGDAVEIASCLAEDVSPGEIVLVLRDGRFYLHRLVGRSPSGGFLLRGDSMPAADPEFASEALLGRMVCRRAPMRRWSQAVGQLLGYCRPARSLALNFHAALVRRRDLQPAATAIGDLEIDTAQARGQECPRYTDHQASTPELTNAGV
jgi:hypothetical protein